jgi:hypothetical protein
MGYRTPWETADVADLTAVLSVVRQFSDSNPDTREMMEPPLGSPAGQDISTAAGDPARQDRLKHGRALAGIRLAEAARCLDACVMLVTEMSQPDTAVHALARAAIESSAWARWLCDLSLSTEERIARVAADELHGRAEKAKLAGEYGHKTEGHGLLTKQLRTAGIAPANRPGSTEVVGQVLGPEADGRAAMRLTYRNLSARPHMSSHVLLSEQGHFSGVVSPIRAAALVWLTTAFEFNQYIGWRQLTPWIEWANRVKPLLAT